ncbi:DegV family protein [uncultured Clostridium sp.]|uniref:DegV family protein n=1 Tax=uncultured Clostridium sp. TaxID=59620 RepID=UPI0025D2C78B|nr:DegV family protein [uncultured Clostridium sp.]
MEKIKIITDSTADLSQELYDKYDVEVLPVVINFGEESYLDRVDINAEMLLKRMEQEKELPTTGQIIPNRFIDCYNKYLEQGYKIITILMSSAMSGTYQSACIAKNAIESDDIFIVDSQNIAPALGILVLKACSLLEKNYTAEEIVKELEEDKNKVETRMCFESLDNLIKGGRISKTAGVVGTVLGVKLVLNIKDGLMSVKDKVRGSKKAFKKIIADFEEAELDSDVPVLLVYASDIEIKKEFVEYLESNNIKYIECPLGSTVCVHSGPYCCGLVFMTK